MGSLLVIVSLCGALTPAVPLTAWQWSHAGLRLEQVEVDGGRLYALARRAPDPVLSPNSSWPDILLLRSPLHELHKGAMAADWFYLWIDELPLHWGMSGGTFWADYASVGSGSGFYRLPADLFPAPNLPRDSKKYRAKYDPRDSGYYLCPEEVRQARGGNIGFGRPIPFEAWSNLVPTGKETALYFLRRESNPEFSEERGPDVVEIYTTVPPPGRVKPADRWNKGAWEKVESFPVEFRDDFVVRRKGDDYYIVTESGQVLLARKPDKGKHRKLETIWGKDKPPITSVLTDNDNDEVYLFCKPKDKQGKPFFFKLSPKPEPTEFDAAVFERGPVDEPLRTAFGMARAAGLAKEPKPERVPAPRP